MQKDPIVEEVRRIRHEIERECKGDPDRFFRHFLSLQKKAGRRLVRRGPKLLELPSQKRRAS